MAEETKVIRIRVDASGAVDGSDKATRALERMERAQNSVSSSMDRLERSLGRMAGLLTGALGARAIISAADAFTKFENALRLSGVSAANLADVSNRLFGAANRNGVEIGALSQLYSRASMAAGELGANQQQLLKFVDGVTAGLRLQGGSTESASGALLQLSQALGSGIVRAEEFNSVLEGAYPIAQAAARGVDGMGGSVAKLRTAVASGQVTSRQFFDGLLKGFTETEKQASGMNLTVGGALTGLQNSWTRFIGELDKGTGITLGLVNGINALAGALDPVRRHLDEIANSFALINTHRGVFDQIMEVVNLVGLGGGGAIAGQSAAERALRGIADAEGEVVKQRRELDRLMGNNGGADWGEVALNRQRARVTAAETELQAAESVYRRWQARQKVATVDPVRVTAAPLPPIGKEAQSQADKFEKLIKQLNLTADAQDKMTAAARNGDVAFEEQRITLEAQQKILDIFGVTVGRGNVKLEELRGLMLDISRGKIAESFNVATTELEKQNEVLEAQNRLMGQAPELIAQEIAMIKVRQDVEKAGGKLSQEDLDRRYKAVETGERLKVQGEELRRSNELWTAPLKNALENIQSSTADWIDGMLDGLVKGKAAVIDFGQIGISILRRMASEILSLTIMRPVLGSVVGGLASIGMVSPATASSLGYGQSISGPSVAGGGGGMSMPNLSGSGLGGAFGFWNRPISGNLPSGQYGPPAPGQSFSTSWMGDITWGQGIGAAAGAGMGIYQLATANGNTGKTIGGIGSIIGAGVSLIPGIGQIAGPIISLASALLPSLFGESNTRTHSSTNASLRYGGGSWYTRGGAYGPGANSSQSESQLRGLSSGIDALFDIMGGVKDPSQVWGVDASSWTAQGKNWSYTSNATHLVDPSGNRTAWRMNTNGMEDTAAAQAAIYSMLGGAVGELTETMKTALTAMTRFEPGMKEVGESLVFVSDVYERFGKGALTVKAQFDELTKRFGDMTETAKKLGLALEPVIAEQKKQTERLGQDYIDNLIDPVAAQLRAFADEKASILANVDYIAQHTDVVVDMARINEALLRKEYALKDQLTNGAISQLEDAIKRLTYGDLANITGAGTLAGMRASLNATAAQARAGDQAAYQRVAGEITSFADASRSYYASSPEYEAIRQEMLALADEFNARLAGGTTAAASATESSAANAATAANLNTMRQLQDMFRDQVEENAALRRKLEEMTDLMKRLLSRSAA